MSKTIQVRNMADEVCETLKIMAAREGLSLSGFLTREVGSVVKRPSIEKVVERIKSRKKVSSKIDSVKAVRYERKSRF